MKILDYFLSLERGLRQNANISQVDTPQAFLTSDDYNGLLHCRVHFWDSSILIIYETVSTELGYPIRVSYAYTYLRIGAVVFRYDNAPHHPEILTYPHHKHIGAGVRIGPTDQPTLGQILAEIDSWLGK